MSNSISNNSNISIREYQPSRLELNQDREKLTQKIKNLKNEISTDYDKPIEKKQKIINSTLSTLTKVNQFAAKHGEDTVIR
ncbi:hypothetical protein M2263_002473 [Providencia alcalifaciens]|nr:hypothetical protein [Providencia alcalifaciens]